MKQLSLFLAWRYLIGSKKERSVSAMIIICFLGILIGSCALALVASIMNGFEKVTHEKMRGIHSEIIIHADGQQIKSKKIGSILTNEFPSIASFSPSGTQQALVQDEETQDIHGVVVIKGIDPEQEKTISCLEEKIITSHSNEKSLSSLLKGKHLLVGQRLGQDIAVIPGQSMTFFVSAESNAQKRKIKLDTQKAYISGTFKTGIQEFDSNCVFCSLKTLKKLFPDAGVTQIGIRLHSGKHSETVVTKLKNRFPSLTVQSWKDLYPALVSALKLEKYAMFLILALITLVASMNIISLMFMQITRKRADIAILQSIGMRNGIITRTFLWIGLIIAFIGSILGLLIAFIVGFILENYPFITLPDAYYVSHLPSRMTGSIFLTVFIVVMLLSFISTWIAARRTRTINISHVLRFEG